jgi:hypothetical protein
MHEWDDDPAWPRPTIWYSEPGSRNAAETPNYVTMGWSVTIRPNVLFFLPQWYLQSWSFYPIPDINAQPQTTWVYEWEDPDFYNLLVGEWQTTTAWTGLTWQQYKGELLRTRALNVMSIAEYHSAAQLEIFPFYHWTCVVWTICMNYLYELFVFELPTHLCTTSIIVLGVVFLCITINHWWGGAI